jgi:2-alkyl-3-oxoalkanoate reductase
MSLHPSRGSVFVTGGTGFVGTALVKRLITDGYKVRVLARQTSKAEPLARLGAEVVRGDLVDMPSFDAAVAGCDAVIHLAAGTSGSTQDIQATTVGGTRNVLELCRRHSSRRLVYISSCSVYGVADYADNTMVSENASLERFPERRGAYSASKHQAEIEVAEFMRSSNVPTVILRPGTIYGPGGTLYTPMMGFSKGSLFVVIGMGDFVLPVVYIDNLVDAIVLGLEKDEAVGQTFNVVDPERLTKRAYMDRLIRRIHRHARVVYFPYSILYATTWVQERLFGLMNRPPVLSCYRLISSQKSVLYDSSHLANRLGWRPSVSPSDAMGRLVAASSSNGRLAHESDGLIHQVDVRQ